MRKSTHHKPPIVTKHALYRYIERYHGFNFNNLKDTYRKEKQLSEEKGIWIPFFMDWLGNKVDLKNFERQFNNNFTFNLHDVRAKSTVYKKSYEDVEYKHYNYVDISSGWTFVFLFLNRTRNSVQTKRMYVVTMWKTSDQIEKDYSNEESMV